MVLIAQFAKILRRGRIGRLRYIACLSALIAVATLRNMISPVQAVTIVADRAGEQIPQGLAFPVLVDVATIFFMAAFFMIATAQRLRDIGKPGWISLSLILPIFSFTLPFVLMIPRGVDRASDTC